MLLYKRICLSEKKSPTEGNGNSAGTGVHTCIQAYIHTCFFWSVIPNNSSYKQRKFLTSPRVFTFCRLSLFFFFSKHSNTCFAISFCILAFLQGGVIRNMNILLGDIMAILCLLHRQPKHTMCGLGLQRSFGRNILEILVYYLMPNKCKNLKRRLVHFLSIEY